MKTTADAASGFLLLHQNVWKFKINENHSRCSQDAPKCVKIQNQRKLQQMLPRRQGSQQRQRHLVRFRSHFSCQGISIFHPFSIFSPFFLHFFTLFHLFTQFSLLFLSTLSPFPNLPNLQARSSSAGASWDNQSSVRETILSEIDEGFSKIGNTAQNFSWNNFSLLHIPIFCRVRSIDDNFFERFSTLNSKQKVNWRQNLKNIFLGGFDPWHPVIRWGKRGKPGRFRAIKGPVMQPHA